MSSTFKNGKWEPGLPIHDQGEAEKPGGDFWQRAAVTTPIIGGLGVGIHRLIGRDLFPNLKVQRTSFLDKFRENAQSFASDGAERIAEVRARRESADPNLIRAAWEQALQSADPGRIIRRVALDADDPLNTIEYFSRTNKSFQANKVIKNFVGQLNSLEKHAIATFSSPSDIKFSSVKAPKFVRRELGLEQIGDPLLRQTLGNLEKGIAHIPEASMKLTMAERPGLAGSQLMVTFAGGKFGQRGSTLELPMELAEHAGVVVHGTNQQTKRIVGRYGLIDSSTNTIASTLKHEQWAARRFEQEMLPRLMSDSLKDSHQIHREINEFNKATIENSTWVNNLPSGMIPAHDARISFGADLVNLVDKDSLGRLNSQAAGQVLSNTKNGLFPSTSGNQLAKGIVSQRNAQDYWLGGRAFPWERQPMQALRRGYGPTARSRAARVLDPVRQQYSWMHTEAFNKEFGNDTDMMLRTIYVSETKHTHFAEKALGGAAGGHALISKEVEDQLEHIDPLQIKVAKLSDRVASMIEPHQQGAGLYDFKFPLNLTPGEIIGYDSLGHGVHFEEGMNILGARTHSDNNEEFMKFFGTRITSPTHPKVFGSDKAVASKTSQRTIDDLLRKDTNLAFEGASYVTGIDTLKKNRALHNNQMLSALHEFTYQNMQRQGKTMDSTEFGKSVQAILSSAEGTAYNNEAVVKGVYEHARAAGLSPHQMGLTFGALPEIYGEDWHKTLGLGFTPEEISNIRSGHAFGISQLFYGGVPTSGGRGSVEPRFFEMLSGPQYGSLGEEMIQDISKRQIISNPETVMEQSLLEHALGSIAHGTKKMDGIASYHIGDMKPSVLESITQKGGIVDLAGTVEGSKQIYIPGADKSMFMRGFTTPNGDVVAADLKHAYRNLLETASAVHDGTGKRKDAEMAMKGLVAELGESHARTITGKGTGLARSKVMGSLYATALPGTTEELGDLYTAGLSKHDAMKMFDQMANMYDHSNLPNKKSQILALEERRQRALTGQAFGGIASRDPNIGPYSVGPQKFKILPGLEKGYIKLPQQTKIITDTDGKELGRVAIGSMAGKAGDYDEDNVHAMLSSSEIEKDIMGHFHASNPLLAQEQAYVIRQQLLKAKAPAAQGLTLGQEMLAGAEKLAMAKEKVGPISTPFREIRAALTEAKLPLEHHLSAMSLMEALEQVPISGKHVAADKIQLLREQMERLGTASSRGKGSELADIATEVFSSKKLASDLLVAPQRVFMDGKALDLPGLDVAHSAETINNVMLDYKNKGSGISESVNRSIQRGARSLEGKQIESYLAHTGGLLSEFKLASKGLGATLSRARGAAMNAVTSAGAEIFEHAGKPLAIGFGASLAIAAVLSKPISNLEPGSSSPPASSGKVASANSTGIKPESLHPDSEISGEPTTSSPIPQASARVSDSRSAHVHIRGINKNNSNMSALSNAISQRLGTNTTINVNIRDRKTSISQQRLDQIIRR